MADGHVFVSYSTVDRGLADELVRQLEKAGNRIWYAPRDVPPGMDFSEAIHTAIERAGAFVVIISPASNKSDFVHSETEIAFSNRRPIYPVRFEAIEPAKGLAFFLRLKHWTDAFGPSRHHAVARLADQLAAPSRGRRPVTRPGKPPPEIPTVTAPPRPHGVIMLGMAGLVALGACVVLLMQTDGSATPGLTGDTNNLAAVAAGSPVRNGFSDEPDMHQLRDGIQLHDYEEALRQQRLLDEANMAAAAAAAAVENNATAMPASSNMALTSDANTPGM